MNLHWPLDPLVPEDRWLAYHYTKLGRWIYIGQWTPPVPEEMTSIPLHKSWQMNLLWPMDPPYQRRDDLHTTTQNLADESMLANGPPSTRAEMPWIPVHKTWHMNLLWPMDPPVPEQRWLAKFGRWTYFGWTQWQRFESSSIHHFWDTPQHFLKTHFCLESGFLSFPELQKSLLVSFQGCWTQWQRFESSSTHHFWDTPQHFLKTHVCLESGFLSFPELQKSLLVSFQGCWTQWWQFWWFQCPFLGFLQR